MSTLKRQISNWLEAERRGDASTAERRLGGLMLQLPELSPGTGFALAVFQACGFDARRVSRNPAWLWVARSIELLALASAGLIALGLPETIRELRLHPPTAIVDTLVRLSIACLAGVLSAGARLLEGVTSLARHAMMISSAPQVMEAVAVLLLMAFGCLWSIQRLVSVVKEDSR